MGDNIAHIESVLANKFPDVSIEKQTFGIKGKQSSWLHINLRTSMIAVEDNAGLIGISEVFPGELDFSPHDQTYQNVSQALQRIIDIILHHRKMQIKTGQF